MNRLIVFVCILTFNLIIPTASVEVIYANLNQDYLHTCPEIGTPRSAIEWTIEGNRESQNSTDYTIYPNGSLLLTPITERVTGIDITNQCCLSGLCEGFVIVPSVINTPIAHDVSGVVSSDIVLSCVPNATQPPPTFSWYRNGTRISDSRETTLTAVQPSDAGVYTCTAMNIKGNRSADVQVTIEYPPSAEITGAPHRFVSAGSMVELSCSFDGLPNPVISWSLGDDAVFSNSLLISNPMLSYPTTKSVALTLPFIKYNQTGYYFCFANNTHGNSNSSVRVTVQTAPESPTLSVSNFSSRSFTISWSYRDNGNSPIIRTLIQYRPNTTFVWENSTVAGNVSTEYTPSTLVANSLYIISVSVENGIGRSFPAMITARTRPLLPPVPRGVRLRVVSHLILELVWEAPLLTSEYTPIQRYECQLKTASASVWSSVMTIPPTRFSYSFQDLSPGTLYQSRIRCANSEGYSVPWVTVENRTNFTTPGTPTLTAVPLDFKRIRVYWTSGSDGGVPLESWTLEILSDSLEGESFEFPASQSSYTIDNLESNTSYYIRVWVSNQIGSSPIVQTRVTTLPKSPLGVVDSDITAVSITSSSIQVSWLPVDYTDVAVSIEYVLGYFLLSDPLLPTDTVVTRETQHTFQDLQPLSTYSFSIRVKDGEEESDRSVVFRFSTTLPALNISLTPAAPVLGSRARLSCVFSELYRGAYEPGHVYWYKGGVHLDEAGSMGALGGPGYFYLYRHNLVFPIFHTSHYGNYSCRVGAQFAYKSVGVKSTETSPSIWNDHKEAFIIAIVLVSVLIVFFCVFSTILCCVFCLRRRRKARTARYPVGIPTKSWLNPSTYSPLRSEQSGFNPLKLEDVPPHRNSVLEGSPEHPEAEPVYTTSFLRNRSPIGGATDGTLDRLTAPVPGHLERYEGESSNSTPLPPLPPPFSAEEVFGDNASLPKRLTITEGMTSLRVEQNSPPSPPSSVKTAPNYENSPDSPPLPRAVPSPLYQNIPENTNERPLYQNIPMDNGTQHVAGIEMIQIPHNCISTDI